jgi:hypothetical protein
LGEDSRRESKDEYARLTGLSQKIEKRGKGREE